MNDGDRPEAASTSFAVDDNRKSSGRRTHRQPLVARAFAWAVDRPFEVAAVLAIVGWAAFTVGGLR